MKKRMLAGVLALVMIMMLLPAIALAVDAKTITATGGDDAIQKAINKIAAESDKDGWTILAEKGEYNRFTVPAEIKNLTIEGKNTEDVIVNVLNEEGDGNVDAGGINAFGAGIVIKNLSIKAGDVKSSSFTAAISNHNGNVGGGTFSLTVENCVITGSGVGDGILFDSPSFNVRNCTITNFVQAIEFYGDNFVIPTGGNTVTGNTISECSFAMHGYFGGGSNGGILTFSENNVTGTDALRCKVVIQDQNNTGALKANVVDNTFENAVVGLVNLREDGETVSDVLASNNMGKSSFYVEAIEPGSINFYTQYHAPADATGHWVLTGLDNLTVDWGGNPAGTLDYIKAQIEAANAAGDTTLTITGIPSGELIKTFTWFKDAIYWETTDPVEPEKQYFIPGLWLNTQDHYSYLIGYSDGTVRPNGKITRAEVATIFFRLLDDDTRAKYWSSENNFSDVSADKWYNNAVSTLSNMGVIGGYADGTFRPDAPISRAEFAKIAVSFTQNTGSATYNYFTDVKTTDWFAPYVTAAKDAGLIEGYSDGSFKPESKITRAEACAIVNRTLGRKPSKAHMKISDRIDWPDVQTTDWFYEAIMEATNSHTYQMGKRVETWNDKLPQRDWAALETGWANAYTGNGGEVR